jgi:hypothetical protein
LKNRRHFILFFFFLLALVALPVTARLSVDTVFKPQIFEMNASLYNNIPKILADLEVLSEHPVFPESTYQNNAQFILSKYLWMDGVEVNAVLNPRTELLSRMTDSNYNSWRSNEAQFQEMIHDKELLALDTRWMQSLNKYDHWNYSSDTKIISSLSAVRDVNALTRLEIFSQLPVPSFKQLRSWALLNFIKLHKQGRDIEGLKTYRHVAFLLHTAGNLVASMTAASMLKDEYVLMAFFHVKNWETVPYFYVDTYSRVTWAWMAVLKIPYFDDFPKAFIPYLKPQNGICAGALEAVSNFSLYRDFFEPHSFFEADFTSNVNFTKKLYRKIQSDCNLDVYSKFLERSPASLHPFSSYTFDDDISERKKYTDYNFSLADNWIYIPYVRRLVGLVYFANGSPINYVMPYETKKKKFQGLNDVNIY